ncbi:hypothetical protein AK812_SmicGene8572 [Symbiodinium microadriaticum]|uniref:ubiquitinyl hydrolase 1 n=1 Tax=Symbiodinium microadriaticum TaxID=2951 RepID=A0A1Q9EKS9_SYMMI|nr:hypothetical protein AK812_SmicGene8572 [Symbiodinium microadriaticum]
MMVAADYVMLLMVLSCESSDDEVFINNMKMTTTWRLGKTTMKNICKGSSDDGHITAMMVLMELMRMVVVMMVMLLMLCRAVPTGSVTSCFDVPCRYSPARIISLIDLTPKPQDVHEAGSFARRALLCSIKPGCQDQEVRSARKLFSGANGDERQHAQAWPAKSSQRSTGACVTDLVAALAWSLRVVQAEVPCPCPWWRPQDSVSTWRCSAPVSPTSSPDVESKIVASQVARHADAKAGQRAAYIHCIAIAGAGPDFDLMKRAVRQLLLLLLLRRRTCHALAQAKGQVYPLMLQELLVSRCWDVQAHPEWLVFEIEGGLQIRPVQYQVAKKLVDDPGSMVQLNMGEGKTRVILPVLILHWAGRDGAGEPSLLRITALKSLLHELYDLKHRHLGASVLLRRVFVMPFHRDVRLRPDAIKQVISCLDFCRQSGGVVLVAPEHRLSLQFKWHEQRLEGKHEMCQLLARRSRELEVEEEVEKEVERQVPTMTPCDDEEECDVSQVVYADSVVSLKIETFSIPEVFAATHSLNRYKSIWPQIIKVHCTRNFRQAIDEAAGLDEYLRPVDAVVAFESGGLLLLLEREGEQALAAFWTAQVAQATVRVFPGCSATLLLWSISRSSWVTPALKDVAQQESLRAVAKSMGRDAAGVMEQLVMPEPPESKVRVAPLRESDLAWTFTVDLLVDFRVFEQPAQEVQVWASAPVDGLSTSTLEQEGYHKELRARCREYARLTSLQQVQHEFAQYRRDHATVVQLQDQLYELKQQKEEAELRRLQQEEMEQAELQAAAQRRAETEAACAEIKEKVAAEESRTAAAASARSEEEAELRRLQQEEMEQAELQAAAQRRAETEAACAEIKEKVAAEESRTAAAASAPSEEEAELRRLQQEEMEQAELQAAAQRRAETEAACAEIKEKVAAEESRTAAAASARSEEEAELRRLQQQSEEMEQAAQRAAARREELKARQRRAEELLAECREEELRTRELEAKVRQARHAKQVVFPTGLNAVPLPRPSGHLLTAAGQPSRGVHKVVWAALDRDDEDEQDVWSMDWSSWRSFESALPAAAAAHFLKDRRQAKTLGIVGCSLVCNIRAVSRDSDINHSTDPACPAVAAAFSAFCWICWLTWRSDPFFILMETVRGVLPLKLFGVPGQGLLARAIAAALPAHPEVLARIQHLKSSPGPPAIPAVHLERMRCRDINEELKSQDSRSSAWNAGGGGCVTSRQVEIFRGREKGLRDRFRSALARLQRPEGEAGPAAHAFAGQGFPGKHFTLFIFDWVWSRMSVVSAPQRFASIQSQP